MTQLIEGHFKIKVTLIGRGDTLDPEFWTAYFGTLPHFSARKGELSYSPNGRLRETPHFWGVWNYRCQTKAIRSIDDGVLSLMKALKLPRYDFKKILVAQGCEAILSIYVNNVDGKHPPHYGKTTTDFLESTGAELSLDVYPSG